MTRRSSRSDVPLRDWHDRELKDLKQVEVRVREQPPQSDVEQYWRPGVKPQFPWFGFGALLTMLICASLTIVILRTSDEKKAEEWPAYQNYEWINDKWKRITQLTPSTALAFVNTVTNVALAVAIGNGVAVAWWRKALHGATVQDLHKSWAYSTSVFELVTAGRNFNMIALCALTAKLALVDNVLLQRAASTAPDSFVSNMTTLRFPIVNELPADYAGTWSADGKEGSLSWNFSQDLYSYYSNAEVVPTDDWQDTRCEAGTCEFVVQGFGVNVSCSDDPVSTFEITPQALSEAGSNTGLNQTQRTTPTLLSTSFSPRAAGSEGSNYPDPWIEMTIEYAQITSNDTSGDLDKRTTSTTQTCQGQLNRRTCAIRPAIVNYSATLANKTGSPGTHNSTWAYKLSTVSIAYQTNSSAYNNVMYSLYNVLHNSFSSNITMKYLNDTGFVARSDNGGSLGQWWLLLGADPSTNGFPSSCAIDVLSPDFYIVRQLDNLLWRASISAADPEVHSNGVAQTQHYVENIKGTRMVDTVRHVSDYPYMYAALSVMAFCILCVLPTYWGFWELGRKVTLGPMEIASAFQAPALDSGIVAAGGEVEHMLKEVGQREVRYGVVMGSGKLAMAKASETLQLRPGQPIKTSGDL